MKSCLLPPLRTFFSVSNTQDNNGEQFISCTVRTNRRWQFNWSTAHLAYNNITNTGDKKDINSKVITVVTSGGCFIFLFHSLYFFIIAASSALKRFLCSDRSFVIDGNSFLTMTRYISHVTNWLLSELARNSSVFEWPCPDGGVHQSESALCLVFLKIFSIYFCFLLAAWGSRQQRLKSLRLLLLTRLERDPRSTDDMTTDMTVVAETGPAVKLDLILLFNNQKERETKFFCLYLTKRKMRCSPFLLSSLVWGSSYRLSRLWSQQLLSLCITRQRAKASMPSEATGAVSPFQCDRCRPVNGTKGKAIFGRTAAGYLVDQLTCCLWFCGRLAEMRGKHSSSNWSQPGLVETSLLHSPSVVHRIRPQEYEAFIHQLWVMSGCYDVR